MAVATTNSIKTKILDFHSLISDQSTPTTDSSNDPMDKVHKIRLGICCMDKKLKSQHHKNVISRIKAYGDIEIIPFGDINILHKPIEEWPRCDVLIAYSSKGYPTKKVIEYTEKYKPCLINDLKSQLLLRDRLTVKQILTKHGIPTPKYVALDRANPNHTLIEYDHKIIVNGTIIKKPFVEKPLNAENHNIYVYYKCGGSRRLFRKIGNRSSEPCTSSCIRREGSYIYEQLIESVQDIKAYTVGRKYVHSETRKAPTVDGIVERDVFNKEVRHKCRLTKKEKQIAEKIVDAFDQNVCGFDIVRSKDGIPFVIDVNGWSFVKNNRKYFDDAARRIRLMCLDFDKHILNPQRYNKKYESLVDKDTNCFVDTQKMHILRGIFGVFRHGDRTPKQKYKCSTHNKNVISLISKRKKLKLKWTYLNDSEKILNFAKTARELYDETKKDKWLRISEIASMRYKSTKMQFKASETDENGQPTLALCILKWGGELTPAGKQQCEQYAPEFRDTLLQTSFENQQRFLSETKVFMTEELRVRKTAMEFTRVLLNKSSDYDINKHLIEGKEVQKMLDDISSVKQYINTAKQEIQHIFYNPVLRESLLKNDKQYHKSDYNNHMNDMNEKDNKFTAFNFGEDDMDKLAVFSDDNNTPISISEVSSNHLLLSNINKNCIEKEREIMEQMVHKHIVNDITICNRDEIKNIAYRLVGDDSRENKTDDEIMDEKDLIELKFQHELITPHSPQRVLCSLIENNDNIGRNIGEPPPMLKHMSSSHYILLPWAQRMLKQLQDPISKCKELYNILLRLQKILEENLNKLNKLPYLDESPLVMKQRWDKIISELYDINKKQFDCSKIPDVFDSCRYDLLHNRHILRKLPLDRLWLLTELLASFVMSQEYGLSKEMKLTISRGVCKPLFKNIIKNIKLNCLKYNGGENICRTFLYFTSESYLHSLRNALILSKIPANKYVMADIEGMECSYFSHAIIRIFEDPQCLINSPNRFYVDVGFSPGAYCNPLIDVDKPHHVNVELCGPLNGRFTLNKFLQFLNQ